MSNGKVEAFLHNVERNGAADPINMAAQRIADLLRSDVSTEGVFDAADEVDHLRQLKSMLKDAVEAVNEQLEIRDAILYDAMVDEEMPNFSRRGQTFYLTVQRFVRAAAGTKDPRLIEWMEQHGREDLAAKTINPQSLRAAVNEIIEENDGECPSDLAELVALTEKPTVGVRKAAR